MLNQTKRISEKRKNTVLIPKTIFAKTNKKSLKISPELYRMYIMRQSRENRRFGTESDIEC